jgi:hypothetical protein
MSTSEPTHQTHDVLPVVLPMVCESQEEMMVDTAEDNCTSVKSVEVQCNINVK